MKQFFKPTRLKFIIFAITLLLNISLIFFSNLGPNGIDLPGIILVFEVFGLSLLVGSLTNITITQGSALDVFPVLWPNVFGVALIIFSVLITLFVHYIFACTVSRISYKIKSKA